MTTPDISRFLRQPGKHYASTRLQQGRILTDADFNESAWIREEDRRRCVLDFVGARGAPDLGFQISGALNLGSAPPDLAPPLRAQDSLPADTFSLGGEDTLVRPVSIQAGAFYLGGRRLEIEKPQPFMFQRDFLQMTAADVPQAPAGDDGPAPPFTTLYFLNAWEQDIGIVEDGELREPALGGSATSTRVRRMRRVEARSVPDAPDCATAFDAVMAEIADTSAIFDPGSGELSSAGRLHLDFVIDVNDPDCAACNPAQGGRYLGADNQTLRIMLTAPDTFVWALDNAAPLYRARVTGLDVATPTEVSVQLLDPPADEEHFPLVGRVVELLPFAALLDDSEVPAAPPDRHHFNKAAAEVGAFTRVSRPYNPNDGTFLVEPTAPGIAAAQAFVHQWDSIHHPDFHRIDPTGDGATTTERFFYVRFWHISTSRSGVDIEIPLSVDGSGPVLSPTQVQVSFPVLGRRGDFWTAAIRPETPTPIVPVGLTTRPGGVPPDGPRHFYTPLALLQIDSNTDTVTSIADCRPRIRPIAGNDCATVTVGDCFGSIGDFTTIADAIDALPTDGGTVLIRPGLYRERVVINRPNIILEGCGENTAILSPDNGDGTTTNSLITFGDRSQGGGVRSMRLETSEEQAILASETLNISLSALHVVARGTEVGSSSSSSTVTATTDLPLIKIHNVRQVSLQAVQVDAQRRPALVLDSCVDVGGLALAMRGVANVSKAPVAPMVTIKECIGVGLRDVTIETHGQVGVSVTSSDVQRSTDIDLDGFDILTNMSAKIGTVVVAALSGVDIDGSQVRLRRSVIRMAGNGAETADAVNVSPFAAVVALGNELRIEENRIVTFGVSAGPPSAVAWGGIQIRGSSTAVVVRDNEIAGGIGHGITLGSIAWLDNVTFAALLNLGAGNTMLTTQTPDGGWGASGDVQAFQGEDGRSVLVPQDEGRIDDVAILNNRISGMSGNGISALTVLGIPDLFASDDRDMPTVGHLQIAGNAISGNVLRPQLVATTRQSFFTEANPRNPVAAAIQSLPAGGIVLCQISDSADINGNLITGNGTSLDTVPMNGIFILSGEGISIAGNRIQQNGTVASTDAQRPPGRGVRAGIAVMLAGLGSPFRFGELQGELLSGGNNLFNDGSSVRIVDNLVMQPEGRALHICAAGPVSATGNSFSSNGFHGSNNPEDEFAIGDVVLIEDLGAPWERFNIAAVPASGTPGFFVFPDYTNTFGPASYLLNSTPGSPAMFVGVGGQVLFQNNQVIYDWTIQRPPLPGGPLGIFAVAILSLDHVSIVGNHFGLRIQNLDTIGFPLPKPDPSQPTFNPDQPPGPANPSRVTPLMTHIWATGGTIQLTGNRVAEAVSHTLLSLWGLGQMQSILASNQTTHANFTTTYKNDLNVDVDVDVENQVMFDEGVANFLKNAQTLLMTYFHLMFRPASAGPPPPPPS